jgi:hypothetical protein
MQDLTSLEAITELGFYVTHTAKREFYRQVPDRELTFAVDILLDYEVSGMLSYAGSGKVPNDLVARFVVIRRFDPKLAEVAALCTNNDVARAYLAYIVLKRSLALQHFSIEHAAQAERLSQIASD